MAASGRILPHGEGRDRARSRRWTSLPHISRWVIPRMLAVQTALSEFQCLPTCKL